MDKDEYYVSFTKFPKWGGCKTGKTKEEIHIHLGNDLFIALTETQAQELCDALAKVGIKADEMTQEEASKCQEALRR